MKITFSAETIMSQIEGQRNVEDVTRPILRIRLSDGRMAQIQVRVTVNQEDFIDPKKWRRSLVEEGEKK